MLNSKETKTSIEVLQQASMAAGVLVTLLLASGRAEPTQGIAPGKVAPKVACEKDATQTYALYLPSTYTPKSQWPVLYAFDPSARGLVPVERFREAAEKYGFIVAGSN